MNCQTAREQMPALILARPGEKGHRELLAHVAGCADCQREYASLRLAVDALDATPAPRPSPRLRLAVMSAIESEKRILRAQAATASRPAVSRPVPPSGRTRWLRALIPFAACALLALGYYAGQRTRPGVASATPSGTDSRSTASQADTQKEIADLKARMDSMTQIVEGSVLAQKPTNDRLQTLLTSASASGSKADSRVIAGLIDTLALDPSVTVRLNALDALYAHADRELVRAGVITCLEREPSPLVQVAMIDFLVGARDHDAAPELRRLVSNDNADKDVREAARRALDQI